VHPLATPTLPWPRYIVRFSRRVIAHGLCTSTLRLEFDIASLFAMLALGACMSSATVTSGHSCYAIVVACHAYRDHQGSNASPDAERTGSPRTFDATQGSMLVPVRMRADEPADLRHSRQPVSHRGAHNALVALRKAMALGGKGTEPVEWVRNLSDEREFQWKTYVAFHPECDSIVGPGITEFAAMFVRAWDRNMDQARMDFLVVCTDYSVVGLHPSSKQHGVALFDDTVANWLTPPGEEELWKLGLHGTRAATPGSSLRRQGSHGFPGVHQQDVIGRTQAREYLRRKVELWQAQCREEGESACPCRNTGHMGESGGGGRASARGQGCIAGFREGRE